MHEDLNVAGRTRILRRNYRSTRQIAAAAADILAPMSGVDNDVMQQEYVHSGPKPVIYGADGSDRPVALDWPTRFTRRPGSCACLSMRRRCWSRPANVGEPLARR